MTRLHTCISTMKLDELVSMLSPCPMRVNNCEEALSSMAWVKTCWVRGGVGWGEKDKHPYGIFLQLAVRASGISWM